jgi:hypothetical protein
MQRRSSLPRWSKLRASRYTTRSRVLLCAYGAARRSARDRRAAAGYYPRPDPQTTGLAKPGTSRAISVGPTLSGGRGDMSRTSPFPRTFSPFRRVLGGSPPSFRIAGKPHNAARASGVLRRGVQGGFSVHPYGLGRLIPHTEIHGAGAVIHATSIRSPNWACAISKCQRRGAGMAEYSSIYRGEGIKP